MQMVIPGQANTVTHDLVAQSDGSAITSGTVTFHLLALAGENAGKWFRASDSTWQSSEVSAGAGVYKAAAQWQCSIAAAAWEYGVLYSLYAKESGSLELPYSEQVVPSSVIGIVASGDVVWTYTVTDSVTGDPIEGVTVMVTTDDDGENRVAKGTTNASGIVTFYLAAGTYYIWRFKAGYAFTDPDIESVS